MAASEYRTICIHWSAIPALHNNLEGRPVEQHPQVSSLITGLFNNRPPLSRYNIYLTIYLGHSVGARLPEK